MDNPRVMVGAQAPAQVVLELPLMFAFPHEFLSDILETAEIDYWATTIRVVRPLRTFISEMSFREFEETEVRVVTIPDIAKAFVKIAKGEIEINVGKAYHILQCLLELDAGNLDAFDCDILIQIAALGEIRYG